MRNMWNLVKFDWEKWWKDTKHWIGVQGGQNDSDKVPHGGNVITFHAWVKRDKINTQQERIAKNIETALRKQRERHQYQWSMESMSWDIIYPEINTWNDCNTVLHQPSNLELNSTENIDTTFIATQIKNELKIQWISDENLKWLEDEVIKKNNIPEFYKESDERIRSFLTHIQKWEYEEWLKYVKWMKMSPDRELADFTSRLTSLIGIASSKITNAA